ncbi:MAG: hypothetical protein AAGI66_09445 [Cyanobacteria bacterium P01_H01_bin.74]
MMQNAIKKNKSINSTAYRIYRILEWLIDKPLTLTEINMRFKNDPQIGKFLSSDSVLFYFNTLKAIGCKIQRPSPRNNFHYRLLYHPYGFALSNQSINLLAAVKQTLQNAFCHQEILELDIFFKKILTTENPSYHQPVIDYVPHSKTTTGANQNKSAGHEKQLQIKALFEKSRSVDYANFESHIKILENICNINKQLLIDVEYNSPVKGKENFLFLPELLFYEEGALYVRGERPEFSFPSSLRVDRINTLSPTEDKKWLTVLSARQKELLVIEIQLFVPKKELFEGTGLKPQHGVYQETLHWVDHAEPEQCHYRVTLTVRDFFYIKQFLLASPFLFKILQPDYFLVDLKTALETLSAYYEKDNQLKY